MFHTTQKRGFSLFILLVSLMAFVLLGVAMPTLAQTASVVPATNEVFSDVYQRVSPSVVSISVVARQTNTGFPDQDQTVISGGTGFVIDTAGHIMTNNHV